MELLTDIEREVTERHLLRCLSVLKKAARQTATHDELRQSPKAPVIIRKR